VDTYFAINPAAIIASPKQAAPIPTTTVIAIFSTFGFRLSVCCDTVNSPVKYNKFP
jgi:hypothetical protein